MPTNNVPYFSQWETPEMTLPVVAKGAAALLDDPLWQQSGAQTVEEYSRWAPNLCGMACLKMILATRGEDHPTLDLARACTQHGGYVVSEDGASIKGLIYAPFVELVSSRFGLKAEIMTGVEVVAIPKLLSRWQFFIASVHHSIRWPDQGPPLKGGHLVLITSASPQAVRFHNPSGHDRASQTDVVLPLDVFDQFFAGRGIAVSL
ncbi:C39 family peptidase [Rhizobium sp. VS19-DR104.2]|uniref:C39 family peptidase n=1 Tax=unclassified Rhizobium TaxID=2613769 RepID=UPI001CC41DA6|nr:MULTISPECIES: C39 family peptidase [unclassified Rhizobium]MBZ5763164.1 C39 family peptidase [Rhizobium sp. VS19-DR96]MBZ5769080.1 C39 family peptidase [Rhizobium sp. VS19-DR129.2]MBZ5776631.1 C39 family peptidase [Rhizobium sp. VS19-DRK62.2]MBZ5787783.1 C39 family peptidase [Rhizobium sp. VS19-DR121]MBZ5805129.1 C39 family peptidase [Rhizobium sp. VS19-DR181]